MSPLSTPAFTSFQDLMRGAPLHEAGAAGPGEEAAALGFSLALASSWAGKAGLVWAGEEAAFAEEGAPYPPGLAQFGLETGKLIVVRAKKREEALWAAEQGLSLPGGVVLCSLGAHGKPLELKSSRRLLLLAERHGSRCILIKPEDGATAAWTRWRIEAAPSQAEARELGPPRFRATITRNRSGPSGRSYLLEWNAHARALAECGAVAGDLVAASGDGSFAARQARAG